MAKALVMDDKGIVTDPETGEEVIRKNGEFKPKESKEEPKKEESPKEAPKQEEPKKEEPKAPVLKDLPKKKEEIENKVDSPEKPRVYTPYEVRPDSVFYIKFGVVPRDGRMLVIPEDDVDFEKDAEKHWVKFKMWSYEQELEWKNDATEYDNSKRVHTLNADKLNEIKIRNLLLDWSFGEKEDSLKLFHINEILTDESLKVFNRLFPTIVRYIVERMNEVLEFNV